MHRFLRGRSAVALVAGALVAGAAAAIALAVPAASADVNPQVAPVAHDDSYSTPGTQLSVDAPGVFANDEGLDDATQAALQLSAPQHGTGAVFVNGALLYTPNAGFVGTDSFQYCIDIKNSGGPCLSNPATVTITVGASSAPVAHDDAYSTPAGVNLHVADPGVLANDSGFDDATHTLVGLSQPQHGMALGLAVHTGGFTYQPDDGFAGTDSFTYCIGDSAESCVSNVATVTITVTAPVAHDDAYSTPAGLKLTVLDSDPLANDAGFDAATEDTVLQAGPAHGDASMSVEGPFAYTPDAGFSGTDSFTYCITPAADHSACLSNVATVTITVVALVAHDDAYSTPTGTALHVNAPGVLSNDEGTDAFDDDGAVVQSPPQHGSVAVDVDGGFSYTPEPGFAGTDSFTYCFLFTGANTCASNVATVTITVTAPAPVAHDDAYSTPTGTALEIDAPGVLANDEAGNDPLGDPFYVQARSAPAHGDLDLGPDGRLTYSPAAGFAGSDSFTYCLNSVHLPTTHCESNEATVTITVTATTPAPPGTTAPHSSAHPHGPSDGPEPVTSSAGRGGLASTGSDVRWPLVLGAGLLALGGLTIFLGRRRGRRV